MWTEPGTGIESVAIVVEHALNGVRPFRMVPDYEVDNVSRKTVKITKIILKASVLLKVQ